MDGSRPVCQLRQELDCRLRTFPWGEGNRAHLCLLQEVIEGINLTTPSTLCFQEVAIFVVFKPCGARDSAQNLLRISVSTRRASTITRISAQLPAPAGNP